MKKIFAVALLSSLFVTPAFAGSAGLYVALDASTWSLSNKLAGASNPSAGYRFAAGYHFTPNWGVEMAYANSSNGTSGGQNYQAKSTQIAAVGTYPVSDQLDVFAKIGYAANKLTGDATSNCTNCSKNDLLYGIGAQYNVNKQFGVRVQYESVGKLTSSGNNDISGTNVSLGVAYSF